MSVDTRAKIDQLLAFGAKHFAGCICTTCELREAVVALLTERDEAIRQREAAEQERDEARITASQFERLNDAAQEAFNVTFKRAAEAEAQAATAEAEKETACDALSEARMVLSERAKDLPFLDDGVSELCDERDALRESLATAEARVQALEAEVEDLRLVNPRRRIKVPRVTGEDVYGR